MPTKDIIHDAVRNALIKEGWQITHDPFHLRYDETGLFIDLAAERFIAAEKANRKIAVEIKSFISESPFYEFHLALGQFLNYQFILEEREPQRILYLAVPLDSYSTFFNRRLVQSIIERYHLRFIVCEVEQEVIIQWIN